MIAKSVPYMIANLVPGGLFFIFAACVSPSSYSQVVANGQTTVGCVWQIFCMPETKGRTLEEIEEAFGGKKNDRGVMGLVEDKAAIEHVEGKVDLEKA
jgi:hypothetical protein